MTNKEIMENPCKGRGEHLLFLAEEARRLGGEEGVKILEEEMKAMGAPLKFDEIYPLEWYPLGQRVLGLIALKKVFNLEEKDIMEMGVRAVGFSFVVKFIFKYFISRKTAFKNIPKYWKKHYTCGNLEPCDFFEKKGEESHYIMRLKDFKIHPLLCKFLSGYFLQISKLLGGKEATIEEAKCAFRGDPCHEFIIRWKN